MTSPSSSSAKLRHAAGIEARLRESIRVKQRVLEELVPVIDRAAGLFIEALSAGKKILFFGNGGSAADSQHLAAELVGRLAAERRALPALALTTDSSNLTALGNDFGFESVFSRQIEALGAEGDVAVAISTSGESPNVLAAVEAARRRGIKTVAFTGRGGGRLAPEVDLAVVIPSDSTQRIQEAHITVGQILCELVEAHFAQN